MILRQAKALINFYIKGYVLRKPISFLNLFGQTLGIILILTLIAGFGYLSRALVGSLIALAVGSGIGQYAPDISALQTSKFKDVFVATNVSPFIFMLASAIGITSLYLLQSIIYLAILVIVANIDIIQATLIMVLFTITWILFVSMGFYLSLKIKYIVDLMKVTSLLMIILTYFSPVYYSEAVIPKPFVYVTYLSPTTHISAIYLYIITGRGNNILLHCIVLTIFVILFLYISIQKSQWREK